MNWSSARELFIGTKDKVFLDSACIGLVPVTAKDAISQFLDLVVECPAKDISEHHLAMDEMRNNTLEEVSVLLNTNIDNVALIESTTHGLNIAANSIPFKPLDEVIICDTEYLGVAIPFIKKMDHKKLKVAPIYTPSHGHLTIKDFEQRITNHTKAICLSSVQWCTGQRVFSQQLGQLCQGLGIWVIVDGIQEAGALNAATNLDYCDFYVAGGHKWLNAPFGCGFMYMSKRAQELVPPSHGYLNLEEPTEGWGKYFQQPSQSPFKIYEFPKIARTFSIGGTGNYPGAIGLGESIKIVNSLGPIEVENRVLGLTAFLRDQLEKCGAKLISPREPSSLSGITMFRIFDNNEQDQKALNYLLNQRILLSIRYTNGHGGLRASTHYYNNEEDILRLCHCIKTIRNT